MPLRRLILAAVPLLTLCGRRGRAVRERRQRRREATGGVSLRRDTALPLAAAKM